MNVSAYKGNAKVWWKFAYNCIVETEIKRKKDNWSWLRIQEHRERCRQYADAHKSKLMTKKPAAAVVQTCEKFEEKLDLFNLLLIRQRVELEVRFMFCGKVVHP